MMVNDYLKKKLLEMGLQNVAPCYTRLEHRIAIGLFSKNFIILTIFTTHALRNLSICTLYEAPLASELRCAIVPLAYVLRASKR